MKYPYLIDNFSKITGYKVTEYKNQNPSYIQMINEIRTKSEKRKHHNSLR